MALWFASLPACSTLSPPEAERAEAEAQTRVNFEQQPLGPYTDERLRQDWGAVAWSALHGRAHIVTDETAGGQALALSYPAGSVGPAQGGGQFLVPLAPATEKWLRYRVKFEPGFDFRLGGKLPGLNSGRGQYSGGNLPRAGEGWSARFVWGEGGQINLYLYTVETAGPWGDVLPLGATAIAEPGRWHTLTQRIRLNTPGAADGVLEVWVDGKRVLSQGQRRWRSGDQGLIDSLFFSTFHGGGDAAWAPRVDGQALFDDFVISDRPWADLSTADARP